MLTKYDKNGSELKLVQEDDTFVSNTTKFKNISTSMSNAFIGLGFVNLDGYTGTDLKNSLKLEYERIRISYNRGVYIFMYQKDGSLGTCIMTVVSNKYGGFMIFGYGSLEQIKLVDGTWSYN